MILHKHTTRLIISIVSLIALATSTCWGWGPTGHTLITEHAIQLLPGEIKPFYDANSRYIVALVTLPDDWRQTHKTEEGPKHYIDLDLLDDPPFTKLIADRKTAEDRFGKDKLLQAGILPWTIVERYNSLVIAFKSGDANEIVLQSSLLAHYIGDAHVPFHNTKDYDGKTSEQKGIHFRWEEALPSLMLKPERINPVNPAKVNDILKTSFDWCISSYKQIDPILRADNDARKIDPAHSYKYFLSLYKSTSDILVSQLSSASEAVAGVYIAAWKEAGKPKMEDKAAPLLWSN